jgi:O-antigen/teichoic acid export membrane protein
MSEHHGVHFSPSVEGGGSAPIAGRTLLRSSALYIVAAGAAPAVALCLLPILTRILTPEDYGVLGLLAATVGVLGAVVGLNPNLIVTARFAILSKSEIRSLVSASLPITLVTALLAWPVMAWLGSVWPAFDLPGWVFLLLTAMGVTAVTRRLGLTVLQMTHRPWPYFVLEVGGAATAGVVTLWLIAGVGMDWRGQFLAEAGVMIVLGFVLAVWLRRPAIFASRHLRPHFGTS